MSDEILNYYITPDDKKLIFFTQKIVIVAKTGSLKREWAGALGGAVVSAFLGKSIGRSVEKSVATGKKGKLLKASPQEILAADGYNFYIPYSEIKRVELRKNKIKIIANQKFGKEMKKQKDKTTQKEFYVFEQSIKKIRKEEEEEVLRPILSDKLELK
nr:hypothetical protein [Candidatus Freyarchaeota archaeon]